MSKKIALVTGGGRGIGKAVAQTLLEDGYAVVIAGRNAEALDAVANAAVAAGQDCLAVATDVADPAAVEQLFARIAERYGRLDLLFNNAGINAPPVDIDELPVDTWKSVVDINLTGMFLCTRAAFGMMKKQSPQGGRIINNGSISAHAPRPNSIAYTATKHAVTGMTKSTALDGRRYDITCCQIDIGNAQSDMGGRMAGGVPQANGTIAPEPVMDVAHVASAVKYMASLPLDATVQFMTVMATKMPFVGRG